MSDLVVLTSNKQQNKRATVLALQEQFREEGFRTAVLVTANGRVDTYSYLLDHRYHYSIPLAATTSREEFEQWVPTGFDKYILEVTFPFSPIGAAYIDLFEHINEVVSYDLRDSWKEHVLDPKNRSASIDPVENVPDAHAAPDLTAMWDLVHDRNVCTVLTKCPVPVDGPYTDLAKTVHNTDRLLVEPVTPRLELKKMFKKVIVSGEFPAEYWDISSELVWYKYRYAEFMEALRSEEYDLAVIGTCLNVAPKLRDKSKARPVVCYKPDAYLNLKKRVKSMAPVNDFHAVFSGIKRQPADPGQVFHEGEAFSGYNNRLMVNTKHEVFEPVWKEENIIFCDGWVPPSS